MPNFLLTPPLSILQSHTFLNPLSFHPRPLPEKKTSQEESLDAPILKSINSTITIFVEEEEEKGQKKIKNQKSKKKENLNYSFKATNKYVIKRFGIFRRSYR